MTPQRAPRPTLATIRRTLAIHSTECPACDSAIPGTPGSVPCIAKFCPAGQGLFKAAVKAARGLS